ncbi:hypothetical protein NQZ68_041918 [Dissostichus eleginoides]|nr:hypothetical protein NQZ68_041918 [Dissostichus eleginoides]
MMLKKVRFKVFRNKQIQRIYLKFLMIIITDDKIKHEMMVGCRSSLQEADPLQRDAAMTKMPAAKLSNPSEQQHSQTFVSINPCWLS